MLNCFYLLAQVLLMCSISLLTLRMGEKALNSWLCFIAVAMNLFVTKSVDFGSTLVVTATDSFAVSYYLGLCLVQEFFGARAAREHACIAVIVCCGFFFLSWLHLGYVPSKMDTTQNAFQIILAPMGRVVMASVVSLLVCQLLDISFFKYLREKLKGRFFIGRASVCLVLSQVVDTLMFSFLGLWGLVGNVWHIIWLSLALKMIVILIAAPFVALSKIKLYNREGIHERGIWARLNVFKWKVSQLE